MIRFIMFLFLLFVAGNCISQTFEKIDSLKLLLAKTNSDTARSLIMGDISLLFAFFLIQAVAAARKGDLVSHREWMLRAVAGVSGAMLQRIMFPLFPIVMGIHSLREFWEYFVTSNWLSSAIVLGTAEWWIRSGSHHIRNRHVAI